MPPSTLLSRDAKTSVVGKFDNDLVNALEASALALCSSQPSVLALNIRKLIEAYTAEYDRAEGHENILHDLYLMESEKLAIGGGPNWKQREAEIWARVNEVFQP